MAQVQPIGKVWLLKEIPWSKNYQHTAYFADDTSQHSWICGSSHLIGSSNPKEGQNYIKNPLQGTIKLSGRSFTYRNCNYICWQNTDINQSLEGNPQREDKYYYAFVDEIRFTSNSVFEVDYTIDVLQTFLFGSRSCSLKKCFIERTHTQTDNLGDHIEPEPVDTGEYILNNHSFINLKGNYDSNDRYYLIFSAGKVDYDHATFTHENTKFLSGLMQGMNVNLCKGDTKMRAFLGALDNNNAQSVVMIAQVPSDYIVTNVEETEIIGETTHHEQEKINTSVMRSGSINGYTPTNKKCYTYPYNFLYVTDGSSQSFEMPIENIIAEDHKLTVDCFFTIAENMSLTCIPMIGDMYYYDKAIVFSDFPKIAWLGDNYKAWLANNGQKMVTGLISSALTGALAGAKIGMGGGGAGALAGSIAGSVIGMGTTVAQNVAEGNVAGRVPESAHGHTELNAMWADNQFGIHSFQKAMKPENLKKVDNFFTTFGYAIGLTQDVEFTNPRFNQHFVKTRNCCCVGGAPSKVIEQIEGIFNAGITIWKDGDKVGTYSGLQ